MTKILLSLVVLLLLALPATASDHKNLDENQPTELEDAYPIKFRDREIQGVIRYIREEHKKNRVVYQPVLEAGILPNTQFNLLGTFYSGNVDDKGSGDLSASVLYNFNTESVWVPAIALSAKADFPTGDDSRGVDVTTKLILSKMPFVATTLLHGIHANLIWKHNSGRDKEAERSDMFKGIFGFASRAGKDTFFVFDYVREQKVEKHQDSNVIEAGFRRQVTPFTVVSLGAGAGIAEESEKYRVTFGFQHSF